MDQNNTFFLKGCYANINNPIFFKKVIFGRLPALKPGQGVKIQKKAKLSIFHDISMNIYLQMALKTGINSKCNLNI